MPTIPADRLVAYLYWRQENDKLTIEDLHRHSTAVAMGHEEAARWLSGEGP